MKNPYEVDYEKKEMFNKLEQLRKSFKLPCLICGEVADVCKSHTISRAFILSQLQDKNHVIMTTSQRKKYPHIGAQTLGINDATCFSCLCSYHDNQLFKLIDKIDVDINDTAVFLMNLRCLYSLYYKLKREIVCHSELRKIYDISENIEEEKFQIWAEVYLNRFVEPRINKFNKAHFSIKHDNFANLIYELPYVTAIACSTVINFSHDYTGKPIVYSPEYPSIYYLHILPQSETTYIVFSWEKEDKVADRIMKDIYENLKAEKLVQYLNIAIVLDCENYVISPILYNSWSDAGKQNFDDIVNIGKYEGLLKKYTETLYQNRQRYYLFEDNKKIDDV